MHHLCHRCAGELPLRTPEGARGAPSRVEDMLLFCPHCSAPQILLPEHMRVEGEAGQPVSTTGAVPPPRTLPADARGLDWPTALSSAGVVAVVGAALTVLGMNFAAVSVLGAFWVMGGAIIALGVYTRRQPRAWMDARLGLRIGLTTGLLLVVAIAMALGLTGVIARFATHGMAGFDALMMQQFDAMVAQMSARMQEQNQNVTFQARVLGLMKSPEVRGGLVLFYLAFLGTAILLWSAGGGAVSGLLRGARTPRTGLR